VLVKPGVKPINCERNGGDALFEVMKWFQQYPQEDKITLKGTFFLDWSQKKEVGLFFANSDSDEHCIKNRKTDGALFICDETATGKTEMNRESGEPIKVEEILSLINNAYKEGKACGCPLIFHPIPPRQIGYARPNNQDVVYWAQIDLGYDLEYMWKLQEENSDEEQYIFIKLILPFESKKECAEYLITQKITHSYLFTK